MNDQIKKEIKMKNKATQNHKTQATSEEMTRKEALKKAGKYAAVTAASLFIILSPKESQAQSKGSPAPPTNW